jgi:tetratricopeptide (TPR) repeat protein
MALANLKEFAGALPYFDRAVKAAPSARVYSNYALACAELKDFQKASSLMAQALRSPGLDENLRRTCAGYLRQWAPFLKSR